MATNIIGKVFGNNLNSRTFVANVTKTITHMTISRQTAHYVNQSFCIEGTLVPIDCKGIRILEYGWFVLASNEFSDGCGGYIEIGEEISEKQTTAHDPDTWIKLLHVQAGSDDYWISGITKEELLESCSCVPKCLCVLEFEEYTDLPDEGNAQNFYVVLTGPEAGFYTWNGTGYDLLPIGGSSFLRSTATGTDAYEAIFNPPLTALSEDEVYFVEFTNANTGPSTLDPDGLGPVDLTDTSGAALPSGAIPSGAKAILQYDGTNLQVIGLLGGSGSGYTVSANEVPIVATGGLALGATDLLTTRLVDATAGNIVLTITPSFVGQIVNLKRMDVTANTVTVQMNAGNIDGLASVLLPVYPNTLQIQKSTTNSFIL